MFRRSTTKPGKVRSFKQHVRKSSVREGICQWSRRTPAASVLLLPGSEGLCLKSLIRQGAIGEKTRVYLAERDPIIAAEIQDKLDKKKFGKLGPVTMIQGPLQHADPDKVFEDATLDFSFLDFCGTLDSAHWLWINQFCKRLRKRDIVSFTFAKIGMHTDSRLLLDRVSKDGMYKFCDQHDLYRLLLRSRQTVVAIANAISRRVSVEFAENYSSTTFGRGGFAMVSVRFRILSDRTYRYPDFAELQKYCQKSRAAKLRTSRKKRIRVIVSKSFLAQT